MESTDWDARYAASPELQWGTDPNRWVVQELSDLPPGRALDLGAGEGRNAIWLAQQGWRVTAVDFSAVALGRGRDLAGQAPTQAGQPLSVEWVTADVTTYQPTPAGYDLVLLAYLHLPPPQRRDVSCRAATALAPGGTLLVIGHDTTNLAHGVGGPQDPAVLFTAEDVLADLVGSAEAGDLQVVHAGRVDRPVPGPDGVTRQARDALIRLTRPAAPG